MPKIKSSQLFNYLKELGLIGSANKEAIENAKKQWRRDYLKKHKANSRKKQRHTTIILEEHENILLESEAKKHGLTLPQFIKQSSLGYLGLVFVVPQKSDIGKIKETLFAIRRDIEEIRLKEKKRWFGELNNFSVLEEKLTRIIQETDRVYHNPRILEETIERRLESNPEFKTILQEIIARKCS